MNRLNSDELLEILLHLPLNDIPKIPRLNRQIATLSQSIRIKQMIFKRRNTIQINKILECYRQSPCHFMYECIERTELNQILWNPLLEKIDKILEQHPKFIDAIGENYYAMSEREFLCSDLDNVELKEKILTSVDIFELGKAVLQCLDPITLHIILYETDSQLTIRHFSNILTDILEANQKVLNCLSLHVKALEKECEKQNKRFNSPKNRFDCIIV